MKKLIIQKMLLILGLIAIACDPPGKTIANESSEITEEVNEEVTSEALDMRGSIIGKWNSTDVLANKLIGKWDFQTDGTFTSTGDYFKSNKGRFRTNESKTVVFIEIDEVTMEWRADVQENGFLLTITTDGTESKPRQVLLTKTED